MATDHDQIGHIARLAILAMCARGVAGSEFEASPEIQQVRFTVIRTDGAEHAIDVEYFGTSQIPLAGMSL